MSHILKIKIPKGGFRTDSIEEPSFPFMLTKVLHDPPVRKHSQALIRALIGMAKLTPSLIFTAELKKLVVMVRDVTFQEHALSGSSNHNAQD